MPKPSNSSRWFLSAAVALLAIALVAAPLDFTPADWEFSKSAAQAKGGGGGGGGDNDNDKGHDKDNDNSSDNSNDNSSDKGGDRGGGNSADKDNGNRADKDSAKGADKDNAKDGGKSASAKGSGGKGKDKGDRGGSKAKSKAKNKAQKRYAKALGLGVNVASLKPGRTVHTFSRKQVKALLGNFKSAKLVGPGFKNHGQRVSTMVKIAKALGFGAWVGAMQANFGTMQELGIASLQTAVTDSQAIVDAFKEALAAAELTGDPAAITTAQTDLTAAEQTLTDAQAALDQTIADAKPGLGPKGDWATVDLDVNLDGTVDTLDLDALP